MVLPPGGGGWTGWLPEIGEEPGTGILGPGWSEPGPLEFPIGALGIGGERLETVPVPRYFTMPPQGLPRLSPVALAYLGQLFPGMYPRGVTEEYIVRPAEPEKTRIVKGKEEVIPPVEEVRGVTAKVLPKAPSAQLYGRMGATGALPTLQQYVTDVLKIPWESYISSVQAMWPAARKARPAEWRTPRQR